MVAPSQRTRPPEELWYKSAIIYQVHVRSFADGSGDGVGDFEGLTSRLDYLHDLGVTAIQATPDGRTLMTGSLDGRIILWPTGDSP